MDNDDEHYEALIYRQAKNHRKYDTARNYDLFSVGSTVPFQQEDGGLWTHGTVDGSVSYTYLFVSIIVSELMYSN